MKSEIFNLEFKKLFREYRNESAPGALKPGEELNKKLLNFLLIGDSFYFILNHQNLAFEFVSKEVEKVLGYLPYEFDMMFMNEKIHPDDRPWFLEFGDRTIDFFTHLSIEKLMKYKVRYDIRIKKADGEYSRMLYQGILLEHDLQGRFLRTLNVLSDITYLKHDGIPVLSFIGIEEEPSYHNVALNNIYIESKDELTRREKQILELLIKGKPSKEIGSILKISKQTVDTHRKNMLHKKNLNNTGELVGKAIRFGWI